MVSSQTVCLRTLGVSVALTFHNPGCAAQARQLFGPMRVQSPVSSPDVLIECGWPELNRTLIRTRTDGHGEPIDGIRVYSAEHPAGTAWNPLDPPFPPISLEPFRQRFVRLHAAGVVAPSGKALLILGETGYGKTTLSSLLAERYGYRLLADEDVFLYRRSFVIEPYAMGPAPWDESAPTHAQSLWGRRPELMATHPAALSVLVALRPPNGTVSTVSPLSQRQAFNVLLGSQRPGGSTPFEGAITLAAMAGSTAMYDGVGGSYDLLESTAREIADLLPT